jgi:hypothetical protein
MAAPLTVLDLAPISSGANAAHSVDLARQSERFGYARYRFAEHHPSPGTAGTSPAVVPTPTAAAHVDHPPGLRRRGDRPSGTTVHCGEIRPARRRPSGPFRPRTRPVGRKAAGLTPRERTQAGDRQAEQPVRLGRGVGVCSAASTMPTISVIRSTATPSANAPSRIALRSSGSAAPSPPPPTSTSACSATPNRTSTPSHANRPETTRYTYLLAAGQLARYLAEYSPDPEADAAADDPTEVTRADAVRQVHAVRAGDQAVGPDIVDQQEVNEQSASAVDAGVHDRQERLRPRSSGSSTSPS